MPRRLHPLLFVAWWLLLAGPPPPASAAPGINATHITVGISAPFSGTQWMYGPSLVAGLTSAFEEANAAGGIQSRNLALFHMDDGYTPDRAVQNFNAMVDQVLLFTAVAGSAVMNAFAPLAVAHGVPVVGPWTGYPPLRANFHREIVNIRGNYVDETVVMGAFLVETLRVHRVACMYQNDALGLAILNGITNALGYVGYQLITSASYPRNTLDVEAAVEAIAGAPQPAQAVVLACFEEQALKFMALFHADNRTDPNCTFIFSSTAATSEIGAMIDPAYRANVFFTQVTPMLDDPNFGVVAQYKAASRRFVPGVSPDLIALEGYIDGRMIVEVLRDIPGEISRTAFLDRLYKTRLYVLGDIIIGLYGENYTNCARVVCSSNAGMRQIFLATPDSATGALNYNPTLPTFQYPITGLGFPLSTVVRPLIFAQLLPYDDPVWRSVAVAIGEQVRAVLAELNAGGGVDGRPIHFVQRWYSGSDPAPATAALADRYTVLAMLGCVVSRVAAMNTSVATIGTYETDRTGTIPAFTAENLKLQASLALEIMALVGFALQLGGPVHLRAPANPVGALALEAMLDSIHSFQQQPASSQLYATAAGLMQGISSGIIVATGNDNDLQQCFLALGGLPGVRLLTTSPRAVHLQAALDVTQYPQATRFHYPYMYGDAALRTPSGVDQGDASAYGHLLGGALANVLPKSANASQPYTTADQLLAAWYGALYTVDGVTLGPYYSASCSRAINACECNQGIRKLTVVTALREKEPLEYHYSISTCNVEYTAYKVPPPASAVAAIVGGVVGGVGGVLALLALWYVLVLRGRRDNAAAPKNPNVPFCILFTDIQSSTHLWATIPEVMATALATHHDAIRRLIRRHRLYEVKTIGDSFMCAAHTPAQALEFALALQREFYYHDWGTDAINDAYIAQQEGGAAWGGTTFHKCWNGLRVRVGLHFGVGDVTLDPVSKGYDYYGTVVNTAARIESVCHGGQIGVSQAVHDAVGGPLAGGVLAGAVWADLGQQCLRGLSEPIHMYQVLPVELSNRTFPPLRLEHSAPDVEGTALQRDDRTGTAQGSGMPEPFSAGIPTSPTIGVLWAEAHPLVRKGVVSAEDLFLHSQTLMRALTTLFNTQSRQFREMAVRGICERLHVRNCGDDGAGLQQTLMGVVQRILPAAVVPQEGQGRGSSRPGGNTSYERPCVSPKDSLTYEMGCLTPIRTIPVHSPISGRTRRRRSVGEDEVAMTPEDV